MLGALGAQPTTTTSSSDSGSSGSSSRSSSLGPPPSSQSTGEWGPPSSAEFPASPHAESTASSSCWGGGRWSGGGTEHDTPYGAPGVTTEQPQLHSPPMGAPMGVPIGMGAAIGGGQPIGAGAPIGTHHGAHHSLHGATLVPGACNASFNCIDGPPQDLLHGVGINTPAAAACDSPRWGGGPCSGPPRCTSYDQGGGIPASPPPFLGAAEASAGPSPASSLMSPGGPPKGSFASLLPSEASFSLPLSSGGGSFSLPNTTRHLPFRTVRLFRGPPQGPPRGPHGEGAMGVVPLGGPRHEQPLVGHLEGPLGGSHPPAAYEGMHAGATGAPMTTEGTLNGCARDGLPPSQGVPPPFSLSGGAFARREGLLGALLSRGPSSRGDVPPPAATTSNEAASCSRCRMAAAFL